MTYKLFIFIMLNAIIVIGIIWFAFYYHNKNGIKNNRKKKRFMEFLNNEQEMTMKSILVGLSFGVVFGFMDNFALWLGIDKLEKYMPGGIKTKAALGNTYSDFIGATIGASISIMLNDYLDIPTYINQPIWLNTVGIVLGCFLGLFAGRIIIGGD
jgi:magnesium-transporting ATPase (P-type)